MRHIIGKAGAMIHKLEQEAGAWISIQSEREMQAEARRARKVTIKGSCEARYTPLEPLRPLRPLRPRRPLRPLRPLAHTLHTPAHTVTSLHTASHLCTVHRCTPRASLHTPLHPCTPRYTPPGALARALPDLARARG